MRVTGVLGVVAAVTLAAVRLVSGEGTLAALSSLAAGAGFVSIFMFAHAVQRAVENRGKGQGDQA